jgi:hypothetical protein
VIRPTWHLNLLDARAIAAGVVDEVVGLQDGTASDDIAVVVVKAPPGRVSPARSGGT